MYGPIVKSGTRVLFASVLLATLVSAACVTNGVGEVPDAGQSETINAVEVLARARDAMAEVVSYRATGEQAYADPTQPFQSGNFQYEWSAPDRVHYLAISTSSNGMNEVETIRVDDQSFMRHSVFGEAGWRESTVVSTGDISISGPLAWMTAAAPRLVATEVLNGIEVYRVEGPMKQPESDEPSAPDWIAASGVAFVDITSFRPVRISYEIELVMPDRELVDGEWIDTSRNVVATVTMDFTYFDSPLSIEAPDEYVPLPLDEDHPDASPTPPPHTPTAVVSAEPRPVATVSGTESPETVGIRPEHFPEEHRWQVSDSVVALFAYQNGLTDWGAAAFVMHVPSLSVVMIGWDGAISREVVFGDEARAALDAVLLNEELMAGIVARINERWGG